MWKVIKVCTVCLESEFNKNRDGQYICINCDEVFNDVSELEDMEIDE